MKELNSPEVKNLIYLLFITAVAFVNQYLFHYVPNINWLTWTILFAGLITSGNTLLERIMSIIVTGTVTTLTVFIVVQVQRFSIILACFFLIITLVCMFIEKFKREYFYNAFLVNFFTIVSMALLQTKDHDNLYLFIFLGFLLVALLQFIFSINFIINNLREILKNIFKEFKLLSEEFYSCLLSSKYNDNKYLFERRLHKQKNRCIESLLQLFQANLLISKKIPTRREEILNSLIEDLNSLFDILIDCTQIRHRVTDYSLFEICRDELNAIDFAIADCLDALSKNNIPLDVSNLNTAIEKLETTYISVLQVTAPEPLAFFLFIESLKALSNNLVKANQLILEVYACEMAK